MQKRLFVVVACLFAIFNQIEAEESITISDFHISSGQTKEVSISLTNDNKYVAFQFDLYLPEGISIESYSADPDRVPMNTNISMAKQSDGCYRFISAAMKAEPFVGNSGSIIKLTVKASIEMTAGEKTGYFRKIKLSNADGIGATYEEKSFVINIPIIEVAAKSYSRAYGEDNPIFEYSLPEGITLTGTPKITCDADVSSPVGSYTIVIEKGTITNGNAAFLNGTLTISSADGSLTPPVGKSDLVYNGTTQDLITAGSSTTGTVKYSLDGITYGTSIPQGTDAAKYTIYYKVEGDANHNDVAAQSFDVTIAAKAIESPTITLSETSYTYDGNAKEPTVTVKDGGITIATTEYSVSYTNNTNVGTATVLITDVEGGNYAVSGSATFSITSADGSLTPPIGKTNLVYNGSAQDLITAGSSTTGTVKYSLDGTTYSTSVPQGTNAQTYTVYYLVKGDENHSDIAAQSFDVTIAAKTVKNPTITFSETSYTYDGNAKEPTVTVKDGETTIPATEYSVSYSNNINVGTATVTITDVEGGNYTISGSTTFAISSADGSLTPPVGKSDLVYNGTAQDLITAGSSTTGTVKYSLDGITYGTSIPQGTDAAKYTIYYKVEGDANHNDVAAQSFDVTIAAKAIESPTITLSETSYTYDGNAKEPTVTVKDGGITIATTEYSVSYTNNTNVGTATVLITDVEGGNYAVSGSATFSITSADGSLTPPIGKTNLVYNGSAQDLITAGSSTTGTVKYSLDGTTYSTSVPQGTNAQTYTVYYLVKGDENHSDIAAQSFDVTIAKALLKASVGEYTITEGDDIPSFTISYDGFKNNETADVLTTKPTAKCDATKESKAGEYEITVSGGEAKNYIFSYTSGKLIIEAAPSPEPEGTTFDENVGDSSSDENQVTFIVRNSDNGDTPTVALADDNDVTGGFEIPETVIHNSVTYKVTEIAESAFQNNIGLTAVSIPESIASIGEKAFAGCTSLQAITVYITKPINLSAANARRLTRADGSSVFEGVDKETCILYVPEGSVDLYKAAPVWKEFKNILAIGTSTGVKTILNADGKPFDIYDLNGRIVKAKTTSTYGLPKGVYIIDRKKVVVD